MKPTPSDIFREVLALGDRVRGLGQRVDNLGARVDEACVKSDADVTCHRCRGTGEVAKDGRRGWVCPECRGEGKVPSESDIRANRGAPKHRGEGRSDADKKPPMNGDYGTKYNAEAVQKAIEKDKRIKPGEAKAIHGLLKGWRKDDADAKADWDAYPSYTLAELKNWLTDPKVPEATKEKARTEIAARESGKSKQKKTPQVGW